MDSLARTRKLPSLPVLDSSSSALERVMLPWFQQGTMAATGLPGRAGDHRSTDAPPAGAEVPALGAGAAVCLSPRRGPAAATSSLTDFLFQELSEGKEASSGRELPHCGVRPGRPCSTFPPRPPACRPSRTPPRPPGGVRCVGVRLPKKRGLVGVHWPKQWPLEACPQLTWAGHALTRSLRLRAPLPQSFCARTAAGAPRGPAKMRGGSTVEPWPHGRVSGPHTALGAGRTLGDTI